MMNGHADSAFDWRWRWTATAVLASGLLGAVGWTAVSGSGENGEAKPSKSARYETFSIRGKIVWMSEALQRRFDVKSVPEAKQRLLALEARDGSLYPLVADIRGRSFRKDPRLRNLNDVELLVRRFKGSPMVQAIRIYSHENGKRLELDYWCEICAIAMFELKACDCCQADIVLRRRETKE